MMLKKTKKIVCRILILVYLMSQFFQDFYYADFGNKAYAANETQENHTNIVAILVDDDIYNSISDDIQWYATKYIQGSESLSVGSVNSNTVSAIRQSIGSANKNLSKNNANLGGISTNIIGGGLNGGSIGAFIPTNTSGSTSGNSGSTNAGTLSLGTTSSKGNITRSLAGEAKLSKDITLQNTSISTNYDRYNHISNSKAIVLKVDVDNVTAPEITKILENLYFDGIRDESSNLVGVILVGDIPLPVVNQEGYIYPTIYPYVDFEEQKFVWDDASQYFVYNDNKKGQAEIWHGMIKFDTIQEYKDYFDKLQEYASNPSNFIGKSIWYEDFIGNQKYFYDNGLNAYINNFLFAEDLGYERYSDLMVSIMQGVHNESVADTLSELQGVASGNLQDGLEAFLQSSSNETDTPTLSIKKLLYEGYISSYTSLLGVKYLDTMKKNVDTANRWVEEYSLANGDPENPIITTRSSMDSHYLKIEQKDETLLRSNGGLDPLFIAVNDALEGFVDTKVESEKYWLNEVLPLTYLAYNSQAIRVLGIFKTWSWTRYDAYENYLFGQKASEIKSMQDASIYRGTYRNYQGISGLKISDIQNSSQPSTDVNVDLNKKSVGGSYEIFAQQVEANRGYNTMNSLTEYENYEKEKTSAKQYWSLDCESRFLKLICTKRRRRHASNEDGEQCVIGNINKQGGCETIDSYSKRSRGGASPLNLNTGMNLKFFNYNGAVKKIFDIGGSRTVTSPQYNSNNYGAITKYSALIQRKFVGNGSKYRYRNGSSVTATPYGGGYQDTQGEDVKFTNEIPVFNGNSVSSWRTSTPLTAASVNYFSVYNNNNYSYRAKEGNIIKLRSPGNCAGCDGRAYTYKTLDSRVKNNRSTSDQIYAKEYYAFTGSNSPIVEFHNGLLNKINLLKSEFASNPVSSQTGSTNESGDVQPTISENLQNLSSKMAEIRSGINSIINKNISEITGQNASGIAQLGTQWNSYYPSNLLDQVNPIVGQVQTDFQAVGSFLEAYNFDDLADLILETKSDFQMNNQTLVMYGPWISSMSSELQSMKNSFNTFSASTLRSWINNMSGYYNNSLIASTQILTAKTSLTNKKQEISNLSGGCTTYKSLCNAIDNIVSRINQSGTEVFSGIAMISKIQVEEGDNPEYFYPFVDLKNNTYGAYFNSSYNTVTTLLSSLSTSNDANLKFNVPGMNMTTSDRPIDSPKYLTFKGIGGDKVTFIYPDIYKVEVFTGSNGELTLLEPEQIANNIRQYLKDVVKKYNSYLTGQQAKANSYYNSNAGAYNLLNSLDPLASPTHRGDSVRPYGLFDENYLINKLVEKMNNNAFFSGNMGGLEPIEFLATMLYYQNIDWPYRDVGATIQEDMDNIRTNFDVNRKVSHILDNYLISDNNKGSFITPGYRDDGYEVAYINSNGGDYITYDVEIPDMASLKSSSSSYKKPAVPDSVEKSQLEEELINECNIPEDGDGVLLFDLSTMTSPWIQAIKCWWQKIKEKPIEIDVKFTWEAGDLTSRDFSSISSIADSLVNSGSDLFSNFGSQLKSGAQEYGNTWGSTLEQIGLGSDTNNTTLNNAGSNYQKLNDINTYVQLKTTKNTINADNPSATIKVSSTVDLGNISFYIMNVGDNTTRLYSNSGLISPNITMGSTSYATGYTRFNPFDGNTFEIQMQNPVAGNSLFVAYMCINNGDNLDNCIKKTIKFSIIPGELSSIVIDTIGNSIMQGSKMPIVVRGLDSAGNNVGQIFSQNFKISSSNSTLTYESTTSPEITFSDFDKSTFVLNADGNYSNGSQIRVSVSGNIGGRTGVQVEKVFNVVKGKLNITATGAAAAVNPISTNTISTIGGATATLGGTISVGTISQGNINNNSTNSGTATLGGNRTIAGALGNASSNNSFSGRGSKGGKGITLTTPISGLLGSGNTILSPNVGTTQLVSNGNTMTLNVYLPDENTYSYKDEFDITQVDTGALPQLKLRLTDQNGNLLSNLDAIATVTSKKSLLKIGNITQKIINKNTSTSTYQVTQNRFSQSNSFVIKSGVATVYMLPNFKAGTDEITISVPGIDPIIVNINVHAGSPRMVKFIKKDDTIKAETSVNVSLKVFDNWENLITDPVSVKLGAIGQISISGMDSMSTVQITNGVKTFTVNAKKEGGLGYIYGLINNVAVDDQQAGYAEMMVQATMLPETGLNIMYLNLFGSDRGNQWGYLSDNDKYVQKLISNSDKLLATTTQLTTPDKIKLFSFAVNKKLYVSNLSSDDVYLQLNNGLNIGIEGVGYMNIAKTYLNNFGLYSVGVSQTNADSVINSIISNNTNNNILIYMPDTTDSIITGNEVNNNAIYINGTNVFDLRNGTQDLDISIILADDNFNGYQIWNVKYQDQNVGKLLLVINNKNYQLTAETTSPDYDISTVRLGGSTNNEGIGIYEIDSQLGDETLGYQSIQDSVDPSLGIGFTADFKNITNFGAGESVGEATVPFSSEFLINIGDPLLKRINDNETAKVYTDTGALAEDTEFDKGLGEIIYSDPSNSIHKVINIDFNNDNLEDIIVVYSDGTIKILKNYGGNTPFQNLGDGMVLADRIKDVVVGDVDGNGYQDIIIWTQSDILRVYHNYSGVFEVDGYPVCLNINVHDGEVSETPEKISGLFQIFFEDMDNDGIMDIVTNDKLGFIKIFYGGKSNSFNEDNYVSNNKYMCDSNWYRRLSNNTTNDSARNIAQQNKQQNTKGSNSFLPTNSVGGLAGGLNSVGTNTKGTNTSNSLNTNTNSLSISTTNTTDPNNNINTVYRFAVRANANVKVLDNSLFRWKGINSTSGTVAVDTIVDTSKINTNGVTTSDKITKVSQINTGKLVGALKEAMNFDVGAAEDQYMYADARYQSINFGKIPVYESGIVDENDVEYVNIGWLTGSDPIIVYKKYDDINGDVLEDGDKVEVTVTLQATKKLTGTFIDIISGPWILPIDEELDMIENFWFESGTISEYKVKNELQIHWDLDNARYMIDNIGMNSGDVIKIHYRLYYDGTTQITEINLKDVNGNNYYKYGGRSGEKINNRPQDGFIDIKTQPSDGCNSSMFVIFNSGTGNTRKYQAEYVDLGQILGNMVDTAQESYNNSIQELAGDMGNSLGGDGINLDNIPGGSDIFGTVGNAISSMFSEAFSMSSIMGNNGLDFSNIASAPGQIMDALLGDVTNEIEDLVSKSCGGFDLGSLLGLGGGNCGLPIPFNESFLGAGDYHLFGCFNLEPLTQLIGKGMPLLTFPGNRGPVYGVYIPAPGIFGYPFKGSTDNFSFGNPGLPNAYPSLFRLYVMPTLTAELGFALCLGPYAVAQAIPDPIGSVGGNCVVFTVPLPCKGASESTSPTETYSSSELETYTDIKSCENTNQPDLGPGESNSPLQLVSSSSNMASTTPAIPNGLYNNGSYLGGFVNIEKTPSTSLGYENDKSAVSIGGVSVDLVGGANSRNKILGSKVQGLIEKVVKSWLDKQIKYIMGNLTNFKVGITWPDLSKLFDGFDKTFFSDIGDAFNNQYKTELTEEQKCKNKGKQWKNGSCVSKTNKTNTDKGLESLQSALESNWVSSQQIQDMSKSNFANPLQFMEDAFEDVSLIKFTTQSITVNVPMITNEDIMAYASMTQNWLNRQNKILEEWKELFYALVSFCGGEPVDNMDDLKDAVKNLKDQLKEEFTESLTSVKGKIDDLKNKIKNATGEEKEQLEKQLETLSGQYNDMLGYQNRINALDKLNEKYDLTILDGFTVWERNDNKTYLLQLGEQQMDGYILPSEIYLLYDPTKTGKDSLTSFTNGITIKTESKRNGKITLKSIEPNGQKISNPKLDIKSTPVAGQANKCIDLFLGGSFDLALNNFLSISSSADTLIASVTQNLETLELYKQFPMQLYEWIHVVDDYLVEISSFINSFLSTLSIWMETNATRYTQYVNAIITLMTVLETYQAIIDLAAERNESCSTCSNDNYDQFVCKLGLICPDGLLPTIAIPPMKIPSIYLDFSHINLGTEIKLPKFNFVTNNVSLPKLPDLPSPPNFDLSADLDELGSQGLDVLSSLIADLLKINVNISVPSVPVIPEPPLLPSPPSFDLSATLQLPLLPPAPKIPALPNTITATIKAAKTIGKILCLVKNFPLVNETSVKAKIEQMSQRTYEVPFWDSMDQTFSKRGNNIISDNSRVSEWLPFLNSSEFKDVELKGFDISVESYVNLQYDFGIFYEYLDSVVKEVNQFATLPSEFMEGLNEEISKFSNNITSDMQKCVDDPLNCTDALKQLAEDFEKLKNSLAKLSDWISDKFKDTTKYKQMIVDLQDTIDTKSEKLEDITVSKNLLENHIKQSRLDLQVTTSELRKTTLLSRIKIYEKNVSSYEDEIQALTAEIEIDNEKLNVLNEKYGPEIQAYEAAMERYNQIYEQYQEMLSTISGAKDSILGKLQEGSNSISDGINDVFGEINERNSQIQAQLDSMGEKQEIRKQQRSETLQGLYDQEVGTDILGYVDYDDKVYEENIKLLADSLDIIKDNTNDTNIINKANSALKLISSDTNIYPATESINSIQKQYTSIIDTISDDTHKLTDMISNDYDQFLYAVANNDKKLVSNDNIEIELSSNLFKMDDKVKNTLSDKENINKMYLDYYTNNVDGYLNAINNYSAEELNMSDSTYEMNKKYLSDMKEKTEIAYNFIDSVDNNKLIAQSTSAGSTSSSSSNSSSSSSTLASYFEGQILSTPEGGFILANSDYTKEFQGSTVMVDINKDGKNDLILRDDHNIYIKYRDNNVEYAHTGHSSSYYTYNISSYQSLLNSSKNNNGYTKIGNMYVKLCDNNWEVKNFKYAGGDFDSIRVSWSNSKSLGDNVDGYLVKMIHRADVFNDKESILSSSNRSFFDKKYIVVLPSGSEVTGMKLKIPEGVTNLESDNIFDISYYDNASQKINLIMKEIPRNWQYSEIYTLVKTGTLYSINSPSSNQIVGGPQIIADNRGPTVDIEFFRPSTSTVLDNGENLEGYVSTNYILKANWQDNVLLSDLWITDEDGEILEFEDNLFTSTGYIELSDLFFTKAGVHHYYFVGTDINGNSNSTEVTLTIKIPTISIINIGKHATEEDSSDTPISITAEIDQDLDEGTVQFLRQRNNIWEILTGTFGGIKSDKYNLIPTQTVITGGYYDFGGDVGLYLSSGDLAAKINPNNGKIEIKEGYEDNIKIEVDYANHVPIIKVVENGTKILMMLKLKGEEFISIDNLANGITVKDLNGNQFGSFSMGKAVVENSNILLYISPSGEIYTDQYLYGDYSFDDREQAVVYTFKKTKNGNVLGSIKIKVSELSTQ